MKNTSNNICCAILPFSPDCEVELRFFTIARVSQAEPGSPDPGLLLAGGLLDPGVLSLSVQDYGTNRAVVRRPREAIVILADSEKSPVQLRNPGLGDSPYPWSAATGMPPQNFLPLKLFS
jgi:hypothetical protein